MSRIKFFMISASEVREKIVCYIMTSSDWPYRHSDTVCHSMVSVTTAHTLLGQHHRGQSLAGQVTVQHKGSHLVDTERCVSKIFSQ